ncbi:MAG: UDP-4-amino-4-deoxy-L-arabinose--oxoglutarate aminotransferase [bacterium ADurb.BinA186]|nr:MAG: UDP-4-amino-4-deoxy-L-arabinose--oxoglutarate aminotransferase [bacterium ADurb.BinA186]
MIEDNCDALGSKYEGKYTGNFGDIATLSFYPAHHITTAEGGAVLTNDPKLSKIIRSIRDWGRHCWCPTGKDNTCKNRYSWKLGKLPEGYDHKYIYGEVGYNLKISDLHSAIGLAQVSKLPRFIKKRKENFSYLYKKMEEFSDYFILPKANKNADPSWFGFLVTIKDKNIDREDLLRYLEEHRIGSRLLFGGNLTKQPYFVDNKDIDYRIVGKLTNTDFIMNNTFWVGIYQGIDKKMLDKTIGTFRTYFKKLKDKK